MHNGLRFHNYKHTQKKTIVCHTIPCMILRAPRSHTLLNNRPLKAACGSYLCWAAHCRHYSIVLSQHFKSIMPRLRVEVKSFPLQRPHVTE